MPKALKSSPKSIKSSNLVTLLVRQFVLSRDLVGTQIWVLNSRRKEFNWIYDCGFKRYPYLPTSVHGTHRWQRLECSELIKTLLQSLFSTILCCVFILTFQCHIVGGNKLINSYIDGIRTEGLCYQKQLIKQLSRFAINLFLKSLVQRLSLLLGKFV